MTDANAVERVPYVGPFAFKTEDRWRFFGRDGEEADLRDLLIAERIVLFYSPSGAGKTSLVQALLLPKLDKAGFRVLPVIRVNVEPNPTATGPAPNRYVASALLSLEQDLPDAEKTPESELAALSLAAYLDQRRERAGEGATKPEMLVFDQLEEILTLDPTDRPAKEAFFAQVGAALADRNRWAIFCIREDYVAGLDPYRRFIPTRLAATARLDLLGTEAGMEAIRKPAAEVGVRFADAAARKLVDDLSRVRVEQNGDLVNRPGTYVEPVNLQVVCLNLWERLPEGTDEIDEEHLAAAGNVDSALADHYASRVKAVAGRTGVPERAIREWFQNELITERGVRAQVLLEPESSQGLPNAAVLGLIDAYLVRGEERRGQTWIELAHDRLVEPVRASNAAWFVDNLSVLQREAEAWDKHGRAPDLLLGGQVLAGAEEWAREYETDLLPIEREFLRASVERRRRSRVTRRVAAALAALLVLFTGVSLFLFVQARTAESQARHAESVAQEAANAEATAARVAEEAALAAATAASEARAAERAVLAANVQAERQARVALARQLAANAINRVDDRADLALLLSLEANRRLGADTDPQPAVEHSLLTTIASSHDIVGFLRGHTGWVRSIAFDPDRQVLASGSEDGAIIFWNVVTMLPLGPPAVGAHPDGVMDLAFSPDGRRLASSGSDGKIVLWDIADPSAPVMIDALDPGGGTVYSVDFSPNANVLAAGAANGEVTLWDTVDGRRLAEPLVEHAGPVYAVAFNHDGTLLASASGDASIVLWDVAARAPRPQGAPLSGHQDEVFSLDFSPDGATLASGGRDKNVILWDVAAGTQKGDPLTGHENAVFGVAFSPDGRSLATASTDKRIILWDVATGDPIGTPLEGYAEGVYGLAFVSYTSADVENWLLASGGGDGTVVLWNPFRRGHLTLELVGHSERVDSVAFSPEGGTLASGGDDGSIILWDTTTWTETKRLQQEHPVLDLSFSPNGKTLATVSCGRVSEEDSACIAGELRLWDIAKGKQIGATLAAHSERILAVAFSPNGKTLATGGYDGEVVLWTQVNGEFAPVSTGRHDNIVRSVAFSPDGAILASGDDSGWVALWDASSGTLLENPYLPHDRSVQSLAFSPDATTLTLATGTSDAKVMLWDLDSRQQRREMLEHDTAVIGLAFIGREGRTLASAGAGGELVLWDLATHQVIPPPLSTSPLEEILDIAVSPDGLQLVVGGYGESFDGESFLQAWNLDDKTWPAIACQLAARNLSEEEGADYLGVEPVPVTCPSGVLPEVLWLILAGDRDQASGLLEKAVQEAETHNADTNNAICWQGSLLKFADLVLPACERAVDLAPDDGSVRDSRGVARALKRDRDIPGAIEDFKAFVAWAEATGLGEEFIRLRRTWIAELEAGRNPFDDETLRRLRAEVPELAPPEDEPAAEGLATPVAERLGTAGADPAPTSMPIPSPPAGAPPTPSATVTP